MEIKQSNSIIKITGIIFSITGFVLTLLGLGLYFFIGNSDLVEGAERFILLIPCLLGVIFLPLGLIFLFTQRKKKKSKKWFAENGLRYPATITRIYQDTHINVNGQYPYIVECTYQNGYGEVVLVKSGSLWPKYQITAENVTANVLVDRQDPKNYYVEVCHAQNQVQYTHDYR